ncbi:MAG: response regulator [Candidatus Desulfatibia sp.]|uniref:hypothetical protein n=1 Tax=Candidatus Desulfatibia sp. TaxID=3101189 RepID=UPI002F3231A9
MGDHRTYNNKALKQGFSDDRNEVGGHPSLADVLIVSGNEHWIASVEKMLNDNLYRASVALNGDQVIERLKDTWHHLVLIDLDSIDVSEDYLVINIRQIEPDIPIIGLGSHASGSCPDITYLKKPLTVEKIKDIFPQEVNKKETKGGRKALYGLILACCLSIMLWVFLIRIWR